MLEVAAIGIWTLKKPKEYFMSWNMKGCWLVDAFIFEWHFIT